MKLINVDCYYKRDIANGKTFCWFVERDTKKVTTHTFTTLNIDEITTTDFCRCFSNLSFINKELTEYDLIDKTNKDKIEELTKAKEELDISYNDLVARANHYIQEKIDAQNKLQLANKKTAILTKDNEDLNERLKTITEKASKYQSAVVLKNDELDYVSSRYQNLKKDVEKLEKKNEELREREKKYCTSHESILKNQNALRNERDKALSDLGLANDIIKNNDGVISKQAYNNLVLQNSLDKFVQSNLDLINQLIVYRSNTKMLIEMVDLYKQNIKNLIKEDATVKQLNDDKMTLTEGINHYKKRVEELEMELVSKTLFGRSASDIVALISKNEELTKENKDLRDRLVDGNTTIGRVKNEAYNLQKAVENLEEDIKTIAKNNKMLRSENKDVINHHGKTLNELYKLQTANQYTGFLVSENESLKGKIKDIGNLLQTLGINIESGDDLVVIIEKVLGNTNDKKVHN